MKHRTTASVIPAAVCLFAFAASMAVAQQAQRIGPLKVVAGEIVFKKQQWVLSGNRPHLFAIDGSFDVRADKIVVDFVTAGSGAKFSKDSIASVTATGAVDVVSKRPGQNAQVKAPRAVYSQLEGTLVLSGGVKGTVMDPNLEEPTPISADRVTVWLNPPDDGPRLKVEGSPAEIRVTPKQKPAQDKPAAKS